MSTTTKTKKRSSETLLQWVREQKDIQELTWSEIAERIGMELGTLLMKVQGHRRITVSEMERIVAALGYRIQLVKVKG